MKYYVLDAGALAYAYVPILDGVQRLVTTTLGPGTETRVVVCDLAFLEAAVALIERRERWRLDPDQLAAAVNRLRSDVDPATSPFTIIEVSGVVRDTTDFLQLYDLSPTAAVTLSAALALRPSLPPECDVCLVSTDEALLTAAQAENFEVCRPYQL